MPAVTTSPLAPAQPRASSPSSALAPSSSEALRVAVLGAGTVGREVIRAFLETPERLAVEAGQPLRLAGVAVRDMDRAAAAGIPVDLLTDAPAHLVASPDTDVVVELMGGDEPARTLISAALAAGKPVVSANKHVVAHHGPALESVARASRTPLRFEAAVGGGIPVLGPLASELAANRVDRIRAIVNGTTNVILTAMAAGGRSYAEALADAQSAGYAEADPTADVEALDAANKLAILSRVAFGAWLDPDAIVRRPSATVGDGRAGISGVTDRHVAGAEALGLVIKLVAELVREPDGAIRASVLPTAISAGDQLARTDGTMNRVEIVARPVGSLAFVGPGAGGGPTASAVAGDLLAIATGRRSTWDARPLAVDQAVRPLPPDDGARERGWFFVLPAGSDAAPLRTAGADHARRIVALETGETAIRVAGSLDDVRAAVRRAVPAGSVVTILPADELR